MKDDIQRQHDDEFELTGEENTVEEELEDIEEYSAEKLKKLRQQLKESEKERMEHLENLQRAKADFLNGKRRLEDERLRDRDKTVIAHVEKLIPLCDSFYMAKSDKAAWEGVPETWRRGILSIENQLQGILSSYGVVEIMPKDGDAFDPALHEAMTNVPVSDAKDHNTIKQVIQNGFIRKSNDREELIRPARVTVGEYNEN